MRILHVISGIDPVGGGPAVALAGLASAQARAGLQVGILTTFVPGADMRVADALRAQGVAVMAIGPVQGKLQRHPRLADAVGEAIDQADIVHIHALWEEIQHQSARTAEQRDIPYIIRPCGMLDPWSLNQSKWVKRIYMAWRLRHNLNHAAAIHFTTQTEADLAAPLRLSAPAIVEPNGVDLAEFDRLPAKGALRNRFAAIGDRLIVLFLSRIHHKKGLDLLVPAFARTPADKAVLVIAGPDSDGYLAEVEQMVRRHGLESRIFFTGMLRGPERIAALVDADLFALPSYQENFGISVVEALAAGVPVVISDQVNIWREIQAGGVGGVVPINVDALALELSRWLRDAPLRQAAAARARGMVHENYSWMNIARRWVDRYTGLGRK